MVPRLLPTLIGFLSGLALSACGGLVITTWLISAKRGELVREDGHGNVVASKPLSEADRYRCYSPVDDEAWRKQYSELKTCCDSKSH